MLSLKWGDVVLYPRDARAMLQLRDTKSQHQTGAKEYVMVRSSLAYAWLAAGKAQACDHQLVVGMPPAQFMRMFFDVRQLLQLECERLTLYSWRRGGASADFKEHGSMETTLLRGRWASARTARLYVQDAIAEASTLALSPQQRARCALLAAKLRNVV